MKNKLIVVLAACVIACATTVVFSQSADVTKIKNRKVRYAVPSKVKDFPVPVVGWERPALASQTQKTEVMNKIVYPVINTSTVPIAAIIIEFQDSQSFTVSVWNYNGSNTGALFQWNRQGKINADAYKVFFEN